MIYMEEKVYIILASDNNYIQHATVAITSILCNTKKPDELCFFLIEDNIDPSNKIKIEKTVQSLGSHIAFLKVQEDNFKNVFVSGGLTKAAYLRLSLTDIVPHEINKILYLDCDLLILDDIRKIWDFDLQDKALAAVEDFGVLSSASKCREKKEHLGWNREYSYFNSGVMLINLKKWRKFNYTQKLLKLIENNKFRHHDQDALNFLFMKDWAKLNLRWNIIPPVFNMILTVLFDSKMRKEAISALNNPAIIHYAGGYKPWEYPEYKCFNAKYYEYLMLTEYKDVKMPQPKLEGRKHFIVKQILRLKWAGIIRKIINIINNI